MYISTSLWKAQKKNLGLRFFLFTLYLIGFPCITLSFNIFCEYIASTKAPTSVTLLLTLFKGGDPAAPSDTATLLRLHPSHLFYLWQLPPLRVSSPTLGPPDSHGVTGGVYKTRERIHPDMLIRDY